MHLYHENHFSALKRQDSVFPLDWYNLLHVAFIQYQHLLSQKYALLPCIYSTWVVKNKWKVTEPSRHQPCGQGAAAIGRQPDLGFIAIQGANNLLNRRTFDCAAIHTEHYGGREEEHFFYSCFRSFLQITSS